MFKQKKRVVRAVLRRRNGSGSSTYAGGWGKPSVLHAVIVIFLEFFAWGLLTVPVVNVMAQTFPKYTFLMTGMIQGVKGILSFLSAPLVGALSDVWGRKSWLLVTVFCTCLPIPLLKLSAWWYFAVFSLSGVFSVTFSVVFAYVADITDHNDRTAAYGMVTATFFASFIVSPALGAYIAETYGDISVVLLSTCVALLDVLFIVACVPESLPTRPKNWGAPITWEQADPFQSLRSGVADHNILQLGLIILLSYLPEAAQYSCIFLYLRQVINFSADDVATFIAVIGVLSVTAQTLILAFLYNWLGHKSTMLIGLVFQVLQLAWFGLGMSKWMMWFAGVLASCSSITYPAISAYASQNCEPEQQGLLQGILTGIRGLSNGFGPAVFGLLFYIFHVQLDETAMEDSAEPDADTSAYTSMSLPGGPFLFGALLAFVALLITLSLPELKEKMSLSHHKKTDEAELIARSDSSEQGSFVNQDLSPLLTAESAP